MTPIIPAPAPAPASPPAGAGGGFTPPMTVPAPVEKKPQKGALAIGVVASIQGVYAREEQKQLQLQGLGKDVGLQSGWGGQGR